MLIYKRNNKTKKAITLLDQMIEPVIDANDPQSMTFLLKQKYELQMISSNSSAVRMNAEMTLQNLLQVIEENIQDYEMLAPDEILSANNDLLLHYLNNVNRLALNQNKQLDQLKVVKSLIGKSNAVEVYSKEKLAFTQLLISLSELEFANATYIEVKTGLKEALMRLVEIDEIEDKTVNGLK